MGLRESRLARLLMYLALFAMLAGYVLPSGSALFASEASAPLPAVSVPELQLPKVAMPAATAPAQNRAGAPHLAVPHVARPMAAPATRTVAAPAATQQAARIVVPATQRRQRTRRVKLPVYTNHYASDPAATPQPKDPFANVKVVETSTGAQPVYGTDADTAGHTQVADSS